MFDDDFMNDILLNSDLYRLDDDEESRQSRETEESEDDEE